MGQLQLFFGLFWLLCLFPILLLAGCGKNTEEQTNRKLPRQDYHSVNSLSFYENTEFGDIALVEQARTVDEAKKSQHLVPLKPFTILSDRLPYGAFFKFNHRNQISTTQASHLGVLMIKVMQSERSHPIDIYRDGGWIREGVSSGLSEFSSSHDISWSQFVENTKKWVEDTNEIYSDNFLKGPWHAIPDHNSVASWEYRSFWPRAIDDFKKSWVEVMSYDLNPNLLCVTAELLKFIPTTNPHTVKPIVWTTNIRDCSYIFLALYSPSQAGGISEIEEWYWVRINPE